MNNDDLIDFLSDLGNARRLRRRHGINLRYCHALKRWYYWDKKRWRFDDTGEVVRRAKESAMSILAEAATVEDDVNRKRLVDHAIASQSSRAIQAAISLAQSEDGIPIAPDDLDADRMKIGVANGVVDLRTGEGRESRREDLITIASPVAFDVKAECPIWQCFLDRVQDGNDDLIGYLQRMAGLFLTGDISIQELFILLGVGANGKSVFLDTLLFILGDYAAPAPDSLLTIRSHEEHATEIFGLKGKRLIVASETEDGARLKVQTVKKLTGDEWLIGRPMRADFITFRRTHKIILGTNHPPRIGDTTHSIWRRIRLIPFNVVIPADEQDAKLIEKLRGEASGILNWMIAGCLAWQRDGMNPPAEVSIATANYKAESDPLADYLSDRCIRGDDNVKVPRGDLYTDYRSWAQQTGEKFPIDNKAFYEAIRRVAGVAECQWRPVGSTAPVRGFSGIGIAFQHAEEVP